jgi:hypothetical protein
MRHKSLLISMALVLILSLVGCAGSTGTMGIQGPQGPIGPQGVQGQRGEAGPQGIQGIQGPEGDRGPAGSDGDDGNDGEDGHDGDTGAKGNTGATGPAGPTGAAGPKGDKGDVGTTGEQGEPGPSGNPGLTQVVFLAQKITGQDTDWKSGWDVDEGGAWACVQYSPVGSTFDFSIETSLSSGNYSLVYYADSSDGSGESDFPVKVIHGWTSTDDIDGEYSGDDIDTSLPVYDDWNRAENDYYESDGYAHPHGAKLWLVPTAAIGEDGSLAWGDMADFLFETDLITYVDTECGLYGED